MYGFNRILGFIFMAAVIWGLSACNRAPDQASGETALKVNGTEISVREFNEQIKADAYADPEMDITRETRERFVDYLIQRELMLQEAVKLELDKREAFVKTIERYWEATLIRNLLDLKTQELKQDILVGREEMETYYLTHRNEYGLPFDHVKDRIQSVLEARHLEKRLEAWAEELKASAQISVNKACIQGSKGE